MDGDDTADERLQNLSKERGVGGDRDIAIIKRGGPGELARIDPEEDEVTNQFYSNYMDRLAVLQRWTQEANNALNELDSDDEEMVQKAGAETSNLSGNTSVNQTKMKPDDGPLSSDTIQDSKNLNAANLQDRLDSVRLGSADTGSIADDGINKLSNKSKHIGQASTAEGTARGVPAIAITYPTMNQQEFNQPQNTTFLTKMPEDDHYEIPLKDGKIDFDLAMEDIKTSLQNASRKDLSIHHDSTQGAAAKELPPLQT